MLMQTDPLGGLDRFDPRPWVTPARPAAMRVVAWHDGEQLGVEFDLREVDQDLLDLPTRPAVDPYRETLASERPKRIPMCYNATPRTIAIGSGNVHNPFAA